MEIQQPSCKYTILNKEGYLVTQDGDFVLGKNGRIKLNTMQNSIIDKQGNIFQNDKLVATLDITDFEDYNYLEKYGENYYQPVNGAKEKNAEYQIMTGFLEMSNIKVVSEMVEMISVSRAYETNQKLIQTYDSTLEIAASQVGKI